MLLESRAMFTMQTIAIRLRLNVKQLLSPLLSVVSFLTIGLNSVNVSYSYEKKTFDIVQDRFPMRNHCLK